MAEVAGIKTVPHALIITDGVYSFITIRIDLRILNDQIDRLSAAYDMLPVNLILPEDEEETALMQNGKKKNLRRNDFIALAQNIGIGEKAAEKMIKSVWCEWI